MRSEDNLRKMDIHMSRENEATYKWLIVAEKPSVAQRIKQLHIPSALVLAVKGHILDVDFPRGYDWEEVPPNKLFDVADRLQIVMRDRESYEILCEVFSRNKEATLVVATDNDPEGELIGWEIVHIYKTILKDVEKIFYRMRFNSTEYDELRMAWRQKQIGLNMKWVEKAAFRRDFDLVTGAAFTRLLTLNTRKAGARDVRLISWGSCQLPTLYFLVKREKEILNFKSETFWRIAVLLESTNGERFWALSDKFKVKDDAETVFLSLKDEGMAKVEVYEEKLERIPRPLPLRTDELLRDISRYFGISANLTLEVAEELYARGYISYPRTDTDIYQEHFDLSKYAVAATKGLGLSPRISMRANPRQGTRNDGAHMPIYPIRPYFGGGIAQKIWEHIARRFLANAFYDDAEKMSQQTVIIVKGVPLRASGIRLIKEGFFEILPYAKPVEGPIPRLKRGDLLKVIKVELKEERSKPPPRLMEVDLLKLLEKWNIGTDATRAIYPTLVIERGYAVKKRRTFHPTHLGIQLVEQLTTIDEALVSPETRRRVEEMMERIERGEIDIKAAKREILSLYKTLFERLENRINDVARALAITINRNNVLEV